MGAVNVEGDTRRGSHRRRCGYPGVPDELIPHAWHDVEQYANNQIEAHLSQLEHRLKSMHGSANGQGSAG